MAVPFAPEQLNRWRLVLGKDSQESLSKMCPSGCSLSAEQMEMDEALAAIYDESGEAAGGKRQAGLGGSAPKLNKWLGDIRNYFKQDVVSVIQQDAIERRGLKQLLFEPEMLKNVEPNVQLVGTLMALK